MRSKKLKRQILKYLDYEDLELDLTEIINWIKSPKSGDSVQENVMKVFENFQYFLDSIDSSYEQLDSNLNHAQRSLEISGSELEERNKLLRQENKKVSSLLNNMRQAVFAVKQDGTIVAPVSKHSHVLFNEEIVGKNLFELLYKDFDRSSEKYSLLKSAFVSVFGENDLQWSLMEDQFPETIELKVQDSNRILKVSSQPMWDEHETLEKILFLIEDVTELTELNKSLEKQKSINARKIEILQEIITISKVKMDDFFKKVTIFCKELDELVQKSQLIEPDMYQKIYSILHTIKGNSRVLGLKQLAAKTHQTETYLTDLKDNSDLNLHVLFKTKHLRELFEEFSMYSDIYYEFFTNDKDIKINSDVRNIVDKKLEKFKNKISVEIYNEILSEFSDEKNTQKTRLKIFLNDVVISTSKNCNKKVELVFNCDELSIPGSIYQILENSLLHIVQNAIDHGIEQESSRLALGKSEVGKIEISIKQIGSVLDVTVKDDGSGIDQNKLLKIAKEKNILSKNVNEIDKKEVLKLIFRSGLSTKDSINEVSGRGVGLDSVFHQINSLNGKINVDSENKVGTEIRLELPSIAS